MPKTNGNTSSPLNPDDVSDASDSEGSDYFLQDQGCCSGGRFILDEAPKADDARFLCPYKDPGPWFKCLPNSDMPPRLAQMGPASTDTKHTTLAQLSLDAASRKGKETMLMVERPVPPVAADGKVPEALPPNEWTSWTYSEWLKDVRLAAEGMIQLGFQAYDTVNVWGFNAPEWVISAMAASFAGGKMAGLYPTDTPATAAFKVVHSGGVVVMVEDRGKAGQLAAALAERGGGDCRRLRAVVSWGFKPSPGETLSLGGPSVPMMSWEALLGCARGGLDKEVDRRVAATSPGSCSAVIYTSGTTGEPKGVMVSHDNITYVSKTFLELLKKSAGVGRDSTKGERMLSYLPLSHVAGMMLDIVSPIAAAVFTESWMTHYFARPYDLKAGSIKDRLNAAKPTLFLGVPLVWEKVADKIRAIGAKTPAPVKKLSDWAKRLGLEHARNCQLGGSGEYPLGYRVAKGLIHRKIKSSLGLDECKYAFTGAAPIRVETLEYFGSLGLLINEVYGMSECTGVTTVSTDQAHQWGSCGWQVPGTEVKAFKVHDERDITRKEQCPLAPDLSYSQEEKYQGELCFRGRHIMMGYLANPDMGTAHVQDIQKKTAETIDREGWLHSGDKGMVTEAGLVKVTGRYKELIIGEGGENIAPVPIEDCVKNECDGIAEVMMVGDHRKYNVALVTLKAVEGSGDLADGALRVNPTVKTISAAMDDKTWIDQVQKAIKTANVNGKVCPNNAFKIQKFTILPVSFSEEAGHLTPTKKLKRKAVEKDFAAVIGKMYDTDGVYIRYVP